MIRYLMIVLLLLLDVGLLCANDYTFSNGWYWKGGQAYSRTAVYDANGCLSYRYTPYVAPAVTNNVTNITHETPNWRTKLLEIAALRDQNEAKLKQSQLDRDEYLQALKALGLQGPSTYTTTTSVDAYGYSQRTAPQGSTLYGYNEITSIADVYGNVDLGGLYQSAIRLAEASQRNGADATNGAQKLVDNFGDRAQGLLSQQLAIAEINAKTAGVTNAARALGDAIKAESRLKIEKRVEGPTPAPPQAGSPVLDEPSAKAADDSFGKLTALVGVKCVSCHGGKTTEAGLNLTDLGKIDDATVDKILARITSGNPEKRMPPGKPLESQEIGLFFKAAN